MTLLAALPPEVAEAVSEEQQLTDRAEQALAALLPALLLSEAPPGLTAAGLGSSSPSPAALRSLAEPLVVPLLFSVGMIMLRRSWRRNDSSTWQPLIDTVLDEAIDRISTALASESMTATDGIYGHTRQGREERAGRIAATLVTGIVETFKRKLSTRLGFDYKRWDSRGDDRVRASHEDLDGTVLGRDETFETQNGAHLDHPGDQSAPMGEWINCRCRLVWLRKRDT